MAVRPFLLLYTLFFSGNDENSKNKSGKNSPDHIRRIYGFVFNDKMGLDNHDGFGCRVGRSFFNLLKPEDRIYMDEAKPAFEPDCAEYFTDYNFLPVIISHCSFIEDIRSKGPFKLEEHKRQLLQQQ